MKKIFSIFAVALLLLVAGCNPKPVSVIKQAKVDLAAVEVQASDTSDLAFFEIEMALDQPISAIREGKDVKLASSLTVIQLDSVLFFFDRAYDKKGNIVKEDDSVEKGHWMEDINIPLDTLVFDLADAVKKLAETDIILPEADKVTLRRPLYPPFDKIYYYFGSDKTFFVSVDAVSGEVAEVANESNEEQ